MDTIHTIFLVLAYTAAIGFFVFGVDDVFFDMQFLRHLRKRRSEPPLTVGDLTREPERQIALFIPAWREGGIVNKMAEYAGRTLLYERYDIFIGVYENDAETNRCVDGLVAASGRIHKAVVPHPGPTSKADCLNWIFRAMKAAEIPGRKQYDIIALHDAEDILHPLTLKVYNKHVPAEFDMAQLPVLPLALPPLANWVGNCYIDEFSELHLKDMCSREALGGVVPSAGVGTAFSRRAIDHLASMHEQGPFAVGSLAEDYLVGLELRRTGFRVGFVDNLVQRRVLRPTKDGKAREPRVVRERVAVRENFPTRFVAAVRQKARWIIGTAFQGWEMGGWKGNAAVKYTLVRDRRAPLVHTVNAAGYCVVAYMLAEFGIRQTQLSNSFFLRPLFEGNSVLWNIVLVDTALLTYRVGQKVACVSEVYGLKQGLFAVPRYPVANIVNMGATLVASALYARHRLFNSPLAWVKTRHTFPGAAELGGFGKTIEDVLVEDGHTTRAELAKLLERNHGRSAAMALLDAGKIDEDGFSEAWTKQSGLAVRSMVSRDVDPALLGVWTEEMAVREGAMPLWMGSDGAQVFAFVEAPDHEKTGEISKIIGKPLQACLVRPSNFRFVREAVYPARALGERFADPLAEILGDLSAEQRARLDTHRFRQGVSTAEALVTLKMVSTGKVRDALAEACRANAADISNATPSLSLIGALGSLFCEVHRILPLHDGTLGICEPMHPAVEAGVKRFLNGALVFSADAPSGFAVPWQRFAQLRTTAQSLIGELHRSGALSADNARRLANMSRHVTGPVDRLVIQLGLATRAQVAAALQKVSGLDTAGFDDSPSDPYGGGILAPGFAERTGIRVHDCNTAGITFRLGSIPAAADLAEIRRRCAGVPLHFEFAAP